MVSYATTTILFFTVLDTIKAAFFHLYWVVIGYIIAFHYITVEMLFDLQVGPTHVVQFETSRESRNMVPLTNNYLSTGNGWVTRCEEYVTSAKLHLFTVYNTLPSV